MLRRCDRCTPCRVKKRRDWQFRLMLERKYHSQAAFLTLTYDDKYLPLTQKGLPTLSPLDFKRFMYRLRERVGPGLRFYACGEYTPTKQRPHYHALLFGFETCRNASWLWPKSLWGSCVCDSCQAVRLSWSDPKSGASRGYTHLAQFTKFSAEYVAGYVSKYSIKKENLDGRHKEFSRQSRNPGIGAFAVESIKNVLVDHPTLLQGGDVSSSVYVGSKKFIFPSYIKRRLRKEMGADPGVPIMDLWRLKRALSDLQKIAFSSAPGKTNREVHRYLEEQRLQKVLNFESRDNIFQQRKGIM